jgi:lysophospholipase L1-like esterase
MALGDSYTIGTGLVDVAQNFPSLLAKRLSDEIGIDVALVNLGVNGYTTADLIREELPVARGLRPELVTILIGANDVVQGSDEAAYRTRLVETYDALLQLGATAKRVLAVSIPDFSAVPGAASFGSPSDLRARIEGFNAVAQSEAASRGFGYVDITTVSREANHGDDWLASDNLHPGPAQHRAIADHIWGAAQARWGPVQWTRWSDTARRVTSVAANEAETRHDAYIGTEHLLLGLLRDPEGAAAPVLSHRRVTCQRVRRLLDRTLGGPDKRPVPTSKTIPTSRVKRVLRIAGGEASTGGAALVGTEHILLALIIEGDGIAAHILSEHGLTLANTRAELDRFQHPDAATHDEAPKRGWAAAIGRRLNRIRRAPRTP